MKNQFYLILAVSTIFSVFLSQAAFGGDCGCGPGTGTPGYWKNHPNAWPVHAIKIGGVRYPKAEAIEYMKTPVKGDKTYTLFSALVAAKLNMIAGNRIDCVAYWVWKADLWMSRHGVGTGVAANEEWQGKAQYCYYILDKYNNGLMCAPSRDACE